MLWVTGTPAEHAGAIWQMRHALRAAARYACMHAPGTRADCHRLLSATSINISRNNNSRIQPQGSHQCYKSRPDHSRSKEGKLAPAPTLQCRP